MAATKRRYWYAVEYVKPFIFSADTNGEEYVGLAEKTAPSIWRFTSRTERDRWVMDSTGDGPDATGYRAVYSGVAARKERYISERTGAHGEYSLVEQ